MQYQELLNYLPYDPPFLFVDELLSVDEHHVEGTYTFRPGLDLYNGHFKGNPVTPGVILTECCAQIGLVCMGIYLNLQSLQEGTEYFAVALSSYKMDFYLPVLPGQQVTVSSEKIYYRFHKLKCKVVMHNTQNEVVCKGLMSGMLKTKIHG